MVATPISDPLDDLARRVARGGRSALAGMHDTLAPDVLRTIRRWLPDAAEPESVLRATFVAHTDLEFDRLLGIPKRTMSSQPPPGGRRPAILACGPGDG